MQEVWPLYQGHSKHHIGRFPVGILLILVLSSYLTPTFISTYLIDELIEIKDSSNGKYYWINVILVNAMSRVHRL